MSGFRNKSKTKAMSSLISVYLQNRVIMKAGYENNYEKVLDGKRYTGSAASCIREYCFKEWQSGKTQKQIAEELGFKNSCTVAYHIKMYSSK